jgi:hypothetical protein
MENIFLPKDSFELLKGWLINGRKGWKKHEEAARRLESRYRRIGAVSIIFSAIVGTSLFASPEDRWEPWSRMLAGAISIMASVLSGLLTFYRYQERSEHHRTAGVGYKGMVRRIEQLLATPDSLDPSGIEAVRQELHQLEVSTPVVPEEISQRIENDYRIYHFVRTAEDLRPPGKDHEE